MTDISKITISLILVLLLNSCFSGRNRRTDIYTPEQQSIRIECIDAADNKPLSGCQLLVDGKVLATSGEDGILKYDTICSAYSFHYKVICTDDLHTNENPNSFYDKGKSQERYIFYPNEKYEDLIWAKEDSIYGVRTREQMLDHKQKSGDKEPEEDKEGDIDAEYPGGSSAMSSFIVSNMHYPSAAIEKELVGKVYVLFIVEPDGKTSHIIAVPGQDPILVREAIRIVRMMPKWKPGQVDFKNARTKCRLPFVYSLD